MDVFRNKMRSGAVNQLIDVSGNSKVFQQRPGSLDQKATVGNDIIDNNAQVTSVSAGGQGLGGLSP